MKKFSLLILLFLLSATSVQAGFIATSETTHIAPTKFQALIVHDGKIETLYNSLTFNANPLTLENFAWVIPVPGKPEVERTKKDIFINLEEITKEKFAKSNFLEALFYFDIEEQEVLGTSIFTRPIDSIQYEIISPEDGVEQLESWLNEFGYMIPKSGKPLLTSYEEKGWYFVAIEMNALHLEYDARDSLTLTGAHTFPVKITFPSNEIIYPLALATIQQDMDSTQVPYSFDYGRSSSDLLGEKNEDVDRVLSYQSSNRFPRLPLTFMNMEIDLYTLSNNKKESDGFITTYANTIAKDAIKDISYEDTTYLTRLQKYVPLSLLNDVVISDASNQKRVNPTVSIQEKIVRAGIIVGMCLVLLFTCKKIYRIIYQHRHPAEP